MPEPLLSARGIVKHYARKPDLVDRALLALHLKPPAPIVRVLNGVDIDILAGEIFGIVGESGCGKSTLGRILVGLESPQSGTVRFEGRPVQQRGEPANLSLQMIFQDAAATFNPRLTVGRQLVEAALAHRLIERRGARSFASNLLTKVGLPENVMDRYPHQFSGGQRQRLNIARALAVSPKLIVCDESVASLDLSIQAQILNLLMDLREREALTLVFISHNLSVVQRIADRVAVIYLGRIVEQGTSEDVFARARHPYTRALNSNRLSLDGRLDRLAVLPGEPPTPLRLPSGCSFHPRCPIAIKACATTVPEPFPASFGHWATCIRQEGYLTS